MIVTKDLRVDVLGEPLFEKVNLVIRPGERVGVLGTRETEVTAFLQALVGEIELDEGSVTSEGERMAYLSPETILGGNESLARMLHTRPTFLIVNARDISTPNDIETLKRFITGFRGGILMASEDVQLMLATNITRVLEVHPSTKSISSYTGSYTDYLVEREKNQARINDAYEKQQKEKRRIEDWLTQKRKEAANDRSPEKGATIRTKAKYLQREILDKEIPKPIQPE